MNNPDAIWVKVIQSIYGSDGGIGASYSNHFRNSIWGSIVKVVNQMHAKDIIQIGSMHMRLGNGRHIRFWEDVWLGEKSMKESFPRLLI